MEPPRTTEGQVIHGEPVGGLLSQRAKGLLPSAARPGSGTLEQQGQRGWVRPLGVLFNHHKYLRMK